MIADTQFVLERFNRVRAFLAVGLGLVAFVSSAIGGAGAAGSDRAIPLLADPPSLAIELDMPKSVQARLRRAQLKAIQTARAASKVTPTRAGGCTFGDFGELGPPAPDVRAAIFGRHVEVVIRFDRLPVSPACRPWAVQITTLGGPATPGGVRPLPSGQLFAASRRVGRAVVGLPLYSRGPYELVVSAGTVLGRRSKVVRMRLACPRRRCLTQDTYTRLAGPERHVRLPLRGIDRARLERSFRDAVAAALPAPFKLRADGCSSVTVCHATYTDPLFPDTPYRVRYQIEGEQIAGCWMTRGPRALDPLPYEDTYKGSELAGCAAWLR